MARLCVLALLIAAITDHGLAASHDNIPKSFLPPADQAACYPPLPVDLTPGPAVQKHRYGQDGFTYFDPTIQVQIFEDRAFRTPILYAHVTISHPSQLRTAPAVSFKNSATDLGARIARRYNAVIAINGDFFLFDSKSYAVRQGVPYRNRPTGEDVLIIDDLGDFHPLFAPQTPDEINAAVDALHEQGREVVNAFTFGPVLVHNGKKLPVSGTKYFNVAPAVNAQRVALVQLGALDYLIVSTQGPEDKNSKGMTIPEMADYVEELGYRFSQKGCLTAYNLDGGSTNTLYFNGRKINSPGGKTRDIADIIYFATLVRE